MATTSQRSGPPASERATGATHVGKLLGEAELSPSLLIVTGLLFAVLCVDGYDLYVASQLVPTTASAFGVRSEAVTRALAVQILGQAVGAMVLSPIADRAGRKPVLLACLGLFGLATLSSAFTTTLTAYTVTRLSSGVLGGALMPAAVSLVADFAPTRWRSSLIGAVYAGLYVGPLGSAAVTAWLLHAYGWNSAFWLGGLAPLLLLPVLALRVPESPILLVRRDPADPAAPKALRRLGHRTAAGPFTGDPALRSGAPVAELFRAGRAGLTLALWATSICSLAVVTLLALSSTFYHDFAGVALQRFAAALAVGLVGGIGAALSTGWIMDRFGAYRVLTAYAWLGGLATCAIPFTPFGTAAFLALVAASGFFASGVQQALNIVTPLLYPPTIRSEGVGWKGGVSRLASTAAPLAGGALLAAKVGLHGAFAIVAAPLFLVGILAPLLHRAARAYEARTRSEGWPGASLN